MTSLTVETLRDEGAGVHVAGSLSMMLRRNLWLYWLKNGAYDLILATTVVPGALPLVLQFTPNRSSIGHYDIINIDERVGVDRPMFSQSSESIWGATVRKQDLLKPPLLKPATKAARTTQGLRVPNREPTRPVVKRDRYFEDEEVTAGSNAIEVFATTRHDLDCRRSSSLWPQLCNSIPAFSLGRSVFNFLHVCTDFHWGGLNLEGND
jgi:hypothetical protein